ncbi:hypothetical protein E2C01_012634 [Portunus trituberculatus]|uniref:Uncharacterized protein n=1 Tax=Portunus trituberculatus TaxID=210409 RepID=A0A5B7DEJ2_PORTR|nr:hypothetical protein [Portunus trituberculatus]
MRSYFFLIMKTTYNTTKVFNDVILRAERERTGVDGVSVPVCLFSVTEGQSHSLGDLSAGTLRGGRLWPRPARGTRLACSPSLPIIAHSFFRRPQGSGEEREGISNDGEEEDKEEKEKQVEEEVELKA